MNKTENQKKNKNPQLPEDTSNPEPKDYLAMIIAVSETTILPFILLVGALFAVGLLFILFLH